jgi:hypothetical protein
MFIITLGDVLGIIFIVVCLVVGVGAFIIDKSTDYSSTKSAKQKAHPEPEPKKQVPWYLTLAGIIAFIAICLLLAK